MYNIIWDTVFVVDNLIFGPKASQTLSLFITQSIMHKFNDIAISFLVFDYTSIHRSRRFLLQAISISKCSRAQSNNFIQEWIDRDFFDEYLWNCSFMIVYNFLMFPHSIPGFKSHYLMSTNSVTCLRISECNNDFY